MAHGSLRLGAHMSISGGLHRALERGADAGCDIVQIFTRSNQQWRERILTDEDLEAWEAARKQTGVEAAMVHGSYLVNLASPDRSLAAKSFRATAEEYKRCWELGIPYLVIHPGAHVGSGEEAGLRRIAKALDRLHDFQPDNPTTLLLENTAGQGTCLGHRFEHLRDILAAVDAPERLGVCIDTCHTVAAGYDITTHTGWTGVFDEFDRVVGIDTIRAFHVNDSKAALGSRVDRHDHLGRGEVGLSAFHALVNDERFAGLPMALETPKPKANSDEVNLAILRTLLGKKRVTAKAKELSASHPASTPKKRKRA